MMDNNKRIIAGWIAVALSTLITSFWAFWGIIENFHEGWYFESMFSNLGLMFAQYLSPMLVFMAVTFVSIFWHRLGGGLHMIFAILAIWFFNAFSNSATFLIILPLMGMGLLYLIGHLESKKLAVSISIGIPLLTLIIVGVEPVIRVSQRIDDGILQARVIHGNGVDLTWAPDGPGWPREGGDWYEANRICQYLNEDGLAISTIPQNIWRLSTLDEAVRSMSRHGQNSGGVWDTESSQATYKIAPDKESPLWNIHSQIIYWWTATEIGQERAYMIVYDGKVWPRAKQTDLAYLGFRCVK